MSNKTYIDTVGREFRKQGDQWQILQTGLGWTEFVGSAYILDVGLVNTAPDEVEQEDYPCKSDNDLFKHYVAVALPEFITANKRIDGVLYKHAAKNACDMAQALMDELKKRDRL